MMLFREMHAQRKVETGYSAMSLLLVVVSRQCFGDFINHAHAAPRSLNNNNSNNNNNIPALASLTEV